MSQQSVGRFAIVLASLCFGLLGPIGKVSESLKIPLGTLLVYRFGLASLLSIAILWCFRLRHPQKKIFPSRPQLLIFAALGVFGYAVFSSFYFQAISKNNITIAVMLLFTYPIWVHLFSHFLVQRQGVRSWFGILVGISGVMSLIFKTTNQQNLVISNLGIFYGLAAAVTYAIYILVSERLDKEIQPLEMSTYVMVFATFGLIVIHHSHLMSPMEVSGSQWGIFAVISVVATIIPLTLVQVSLQRIPATQMVLLSLFEPVAAVISALIFFEENLAIIQWVGIGLILFSFLLSQVDQETKLNVKA